MPNIMSELWFPPTKGTDIAKKAFEAVKKFPVDETLGTQLASGLVGDRKGIKSITITSVKEGKLEEALNLTGEILRFYAEIEGVTYKTDIMTTPEEAYATVGMKPPE